ncbi:MAG: aspartate carbamoyltransferase regulatory subunit [Clostridiales bacterium]|nr:aspartate carbamoyltransferase regulatory subunit [Clostridiales bacterium]
MNIDGINTGYVLDHIKAGKGFELYHLLGLDKADCTVAIIQRASSAKYGMKDIIKIDADIPIDYDLIGYIDTNITVNVVKDRKLVKKVRPVPPEVLTDVIECRNPRCITSVERGIPQKFRLIDKDTRSYRCVYCDTLYRENK